MQLMQNHVGVSLLAASLMPTFVLGGQKLDVRIIDRQYHENHYTYFVPGYSTANASTNVNCFGEVSVNCSGSTHVTGTTVPPSQRSFDVQGATFSLQLPDGRIAVVNCESKFKERFAGPQGNRRSCRMPLVDNISAEFDGNSAKLQWVVSIDGKKMDSETYRILGVLDKK